MRELEKGKIITLYVGNKKGSNKRYFRIEEIIGVGATCICYRVIEIDDNQQSKNLHYLLKECCPYFVKRDKTEVKWKNDEIRKKYFDRFEKSFELQKKILLINDVFLDFTEHPIEDLLYGYNTNTVYSLTILTNTQTFSSIRHRQSLTNYLRTVKTVAETMKKYHDKGLLHLDIKPDNIMVSSDSNKPDNIMLIDYNSIVLMGDIKDGTLLSYSRGYSAPELMQGDIKMISEKTDIYSIGAMIFEALFNRLPKTADMLETAGWDWHFHKMIKDENGAYLMNPKIEKVLKKILKKTLYILPEQRFSDEELIKHLNEAIILSREERYIKKDYVTAGEDFIGRDSELEHIHTLFNDDKQKDYCRQPVILYGFSGIGKSQISRKYIEKYSETYDIVIYREYKNTLEELIRTITITERDNEGSNKSISADWKTLGDMMEGRKCLFVIDGYDVYADKKRGDSDQDELEKLHADVLITSRTRFPKEIVRWPQIKVESLSNKEIIRLFESESERQLGEEEKDYLETVIKFVEGNTYYISLLAKLVRVSETSVMDILKKAFDISNYSSMEDIHDERDDGNLKTVTEAIEQLFRMSEVFTGPDAMVNKKILWALYLLDFASINKTLLMEIAGDNKKTRNCFNDLVERGWIQRIITVDQINAGTGSTYTIHSLLGNVIKMDSPPTADKLDYLKVFLTESISETLSSDENYYFTTMMEKDEDSYLDTSQFPLYLLKSISDKLGEYETAKDILFDGCLNAKECLGWDSYDKPIASFLIRLCNETKLDYKSFLISVCMAANTPSVVELVALRKYVEENYDKAVSELMSTTDEEKKNAYYQRLFETVIELLETASKFRLPLFKDDVKAKEIEESILHYRANHKSNKQPGFKEFEEFEQENTKKLIEDGDSFWNECDAYWNNAMASFVYEDAEYDRVVDEGKRLFCKMIHQDDLSVEDRIKLLDSYYVLYSGSGIESDNKFIYECIEAIIKEDPYSIFFLADYWLNETDLNEEWQSKYQTYQLKRLLCFYIENMVPFIEMTDSITDSDKRVVYLIYFLDKACGLVDSFALSPFDRDSELVKDSMDLSITIGQKILPYCLEIIDKDAGCCKKIAEVSFDKKRRNILRLKIAHCYVQVGTELEETSFVEKGTEILFSVTKEVFDNKTNRNEAEVLEAWEELKEYANFFIDRWIITPICNREKIWYYLYYYSIVSKSLRHLSGGKQYLKRFTEDIYYNYRIAKDIEAGKTESEEGGESKEIEREINEILAGLEKDEYWQEQKLERHHKRIVVFE